MHRLKQMLRDVLVLFCEQFFTKFVTKQFKCAELRLCSKQISLIRKSLTNRKKRWKQIKIELKFFSFCFDESSSIRLRITQKLKWSLLNVCTVGYHWNKNAMKPFPLKNKNHSNVVIFSVQILISNVWVNVSFGIPKSITTKAIEHKGQRFVADVLTYQWRFFYMKFFRHFTIMSNLFAFFAVRDFAHILFFIATCFVLCGFGIPNFLDYLNWVTVQFKKANISVLSKYP